MLARMVEHVEYSIAPKFALQQKDHQIKGGYPSKSQAKTEEPPLQPADEQNDDAVVPLRRRVFYSVYSK